MSKSSTKDNNTVMKNVDLYLEESADPFYSSINQTILEESIKQLESGRAAPHEIKTSCEAIK